MELDIKIKSFISWLFKKFELNSKFNERELSKCMKEYQEDESVLLDERSESLKIILKEILRIMEENKNA